MLGRLGSPRATFALPPTSTAITPVSTIRVASTRRIRNELNSLSPRVGLGPRDHAHNALTITTAFSARICIVRHPCARLLHELRAVPFHVPLVPAPRLRSPGRGRPGSPSCLG